MDFLQRLEAAIKNHLKENYLPPHRAKTPEWTYHDLRFFAKGADTLSTAFTEGRSELPKNYFNKKEFRSAYLLYFLIPNFVKVWKCLEQVFEESPLQRRPTPSRGTLKILDLGSGPGTAALACSAFFKDRSLEILGFEQNGSIRQDASALWQKLAPPHHHLRFSKYPVLTAKADLAIAANFLSEFSFHQQINFCTSTLLHSDTFIIIEPALRRTTRQLMALRDEILKRGQARVLAPCLHQQNCPMLTANKRDWCHFYIDWKCPLFIRQIDELIGNKHDYLKMAYMIFSAKRCQQYTAGTFWRVVSFPLISKGKKELILCGACGLLKKIRRLNKDKSEANKVFDQIKRGDIVRETDFVSIIQNF